MTPAQKRRLYMVLGILVGVGVATAFALQSFKSSIGLRTPTEVLSTTAKEGKRFQLGGMVTKGSVQRTPGTLEIRFRVTDFQHEIPVIYNGVLPDLFKDGKGVQANGRLDAHGVFVADEIIAKHDENYMPPAMGKALKRGESRLEESSPQSSPSSAVNP